MQIAQKSKYENLLLQEVEGFPASEVKKILRIVQFFKNEILQIDKPKDEGCQEFWDSFGSWQDDLPAKDIIKEIKNSSHL